jgi:hypothetical protein
MTAIATAGIARRRSYIKLSNYHVLSRCNGQEGGRTHRAACIRPPPTSHAPRRTTSTSTQPAIAARLLLLPLLLARRFPLLAAGAVFVKRRGRCLLPAGRHQLRLHRPPRCRDTSWRRNAAFAMCRGGGGEFKTCRGCFFLHNRTGAVERRDSHRREQVSDECLPH